MSGEAWIASSARPSSGLGKMPASELRFAEPKSRFDVGRRQRSPSECAGEARHRQIELSRATLRLGRAEGTDPPCQRQGVLRCGGDGPGMERHRLGGSPGCRQKLARLAPEDRRLAGRRDGAPSQQLDPALGRGEIAARQDRRQREVIARVELESGARSTALFLDLSRPGEGAGGLEKPADRRLRLVRPGSEEHPKGVRVAALALELGDALECPVGRGRALAHLAVEIGRGDAVTGPVQRVRREEQTRGVPRDLQTLEERRESLLACLGARGLHQVDAGVAIQLARVRDAAIPLREVGAPQQELSQLLPAFRALEDLG